MNPRKIMSNISTSVVAALFVGPLLIPTAEAAPLSTDQIWKLQLRVRIADVTNAGTDADIKVSLNTSNGTWIDTNVNDFERNSNRLHYLLHTGVAWFADITKLDIYHNNSDAMCIRSLELVVNGVPVYLIDYGSAGKWLQNGTLSIPGTTLRGSMTWRNYVTPALPAKMAFRTLENRIEAAWGHMMKGTKSKWSDGDVYALNPDNWSEYPKALPTASPVYDFNPDGSFRRVINLTYFLRSQEHANGTRVYVKHELIVDGGFDKLCTTAFEVDMRVVNGRLEITYHDMTAQISATAFENAVWGWAEFAKQIISMFSGGVVSNALDVIMYVAKSQYATQTATNPAENKYVTVSFPVKPGATRVAKRKIDGEWWFVFE